mmetsp:Transcript_29300/g.74636  ORF Transcript_29300/g.74636 Transcript_29300/m.74636 type:complete len:325 (-) Transcript_29300:1909-2883(-)
MHPPHCPRFSNSFHASFSTSKIMSAMATCSGDPSRCRTLSGCTSRLARIHTLRICGRSSMSPTPTGAHPLPSHSTVCSDPSSPRMLPLLRFFHVSTLALCALLSSTCCSLRRASSSSLACFSASAARILACFSARRAARSCRLSSGSPSVPSVSSYRSWCALVSTSSCSPAMRSTAALAAGRGLGTELAPGLAAPPAAAAGVPADDAVGTENMSCTELACDMVAGVALAELPPAKKSCMSSTSAVTGWCAGCDAGCGTGACAAGGVAAVEAAGATAAGGGAAAWDESGPGPNPSRSSTAAGAADRGAALALVAPLCPMPSRSSW